MLETGRFPVDDAISVVVPPEAAAVVLANWSANPTQYTKIMVDSAKTPLCILASTRT